jgi:hypothetical protein
MDNQMKGSHIIFKPLQLKEPLQGPAQNPINGSDAESFAMARVLLACRGEGQWGSREDDNSKIDVVFSIEHPWLPGERMTVLAQIKSGKSFGERVGDGFRLKSPAKKAAKRTSHDICAIWVDRNDDKVFWAYHHPNASTGIQLYGRHHEVTPAMRYDLGRLLGRNAPKPAGGKGVIIGAVGTSSFQSKRLAALAHYRSLKKVLSPTLGEVELTRIGWRHMFRRSRSSANKAASIRVIPYLQHILSQRPTAHSITPIGIAHMGGYEHRTCEHLLKYDQVLIARTGLPNSQVTVHLRLIEEIRYPANWSQKAMLSQQVDRRVVLKSAYYK